MAAREELWERRDRIPPPTHRRRSLGFVAAPVFLTLAAILILGYQRTLMHVTLVSDGNISSIRTHQTTVEAVLREAGFVLSSEDVVEPALSAPVFNGASIAVYRARPVVVRVEDELISARTQLTTTQDILAQLGVEVGQHDVIHSRVDPPADGAGRESLEIRVERAVPITVLEDGVPPLRLYSTAPTVGEALYEAGIVLYLADEVRPALSSPLEPGTQVSIRRSVPVTIHADGKTLRTRTHSLTVGQVLSDLNVTLQGLDYAAPDVETPLGEGSEISVTRVAEEVLVQQEPIPFESQWAPDPELEIDHQRLGQEGLPGVYERRIRIRYENGAEVGRWVEGEWTARAPRPKILNYGTKIVLRTLDSPAGAVQYWRKYRMLATSYSAASSGKALDHPYYGITRLGWRMRDGIVAVDPKIIRLGSKVYVPGYGVGDAADTGGAINNLRIDLGYSEENYTSWYRCVDVYLLAPVPDSVEYVVSSLVHPWCR